MAITVSIECPACATAFPIDPDKVPLGGARTECTVCETPFRVDPVSWGGGEAEEPEPWVADQEGHEEVAAWEEASQAFEGLTLVEDAAAASDPGESEATEQPREDAGEPVDEVGTEGGWEDVQGPDLRLEAADQEEAAMESVEEPAADESGLADAFTGSSDETHETSFEAPTFETPSFEAPTSEATVSEEPAFEESPLEAAAAEETPFGEDAAAEAPSETTPFEETAFEATAFEEVTLEEAALEEAAPAEAGFEVSSFEEGGDDQESPLDGVPHTGDLVTDQWAELVDTGADEGGDVSGDWGSEEGDSWVLETEEDPGLAMGGIEVERLHTVEDQVRAAQDDPYLTAPAEGVDTNEVSPEVDGDFGDFMSGQETMLPADALEVDGPGLDLPEPPVVDDFETAAGGFAPEAGDAAGLPESTEAAPVGDEGGAAATFQFGRRDPHDKARRLARVLVSDMITYNPDRHTEARRNGSVPQDFEDEIQKSWAEYVEQVGPELAESTDYWRDALNEVLAGGEPLF